MAVFLFFGEDTYGHKEKLKFWQNEFEKKYDGDTNTAILAGKNLKANELFQMCCAMPFLAEKRLVIVKDFFAEGDAEEKTIMADFIEKIPDFCILIFSEKEDVDKRVGLYKKITKFGKLVPFTNISGSKLIAWIEKKIAAINGTIEKEAVIFLMELIPGDLYRLENEIAKLVGFAGDRAITKDDVELLVNTQLTTSIFKLTDGIGQKNRKVSLDTLHNLIETGEPLHRILYMIMRQFRIITCVKDLMLQGMNQYEITSKVKEHPYVVSNTMSQARNFSLEQLKAAYKLLIKIDTKLKSGGIKILVGDTREFVLALDRLVVELCE